MDAGGQGCEEMGIVSEGESSTPEALGLLDEEDDDEEDFFRELEEEEDDLEEEEDFFDEPLDFLEEGEAMAAGIG